MFKEELNKCPCILDGLSTFFLYLFKQIVIAYDSAEMEREEYKNNQILSL